MTLRFSLGFMIMLKLEVFAILNFRCPQCTPDDQEILLSFVLSSDRLEIPQEDIVFSKLRELLRVGVQLN